MAKINLKQYGITGTTEVIYNPSYDELYREETRKGLRGYEKGYKRSETTFGSSHSIRASRSTCQTTKREEGKPPHTKHVTAPRLYAPSSSPKPTVERADRHARSIQLHHGCAPFQLRHICGPAWRPGPTCHATGAPVTTCKETAPPLAPMPRLLGYRTSAATRGSPARDPTVPIKCDGHGSASYGDRHDD